MCKPVFQGTSRVRLAESYVGRAQKAGTAWNQVLCTAQSALRASSAQYVTHYSYLWFLIQLCV